MMQLDVDHFYQQVDTSIDYLALPDQKMNTAEVQVRTQTSCITFC